MSYIPSGTIRLIDKASYVGNVFVSNEYCTVHSLQSIFAKTMSLHGQYSVTYTISPLVRCRNNDDDNGVCVVSVTLFINAGFVFVRDQHRMNEQNRRFRKILFVLPTCTHKNSDTSMHSPWSSVTCTGHSHSRAASEDRVEMRVQPKC